MTDRLVLLLTLALLFVWSLPGTIALRSILMLAALLLALATLGRADWRDILARAGLPLLLVGALSLWLLLQALTISPEPAWALDEIGGQWVKALLALLLGLAVGHRAGVGARLATGIVLVFAAQGAIAIGQSVAHWFAHGELLRQQVPLTGGKLEMSFVLNLLLAFLLADLFAHASRRQRLLALPLPAVLALLAIPYVANYLGGARNGIIGAVLMTLSALYFFVFDQRRRLGWRRVFGLTAAVTLALATLLVFSVRADARWQSFAETARIAWDIDTHAAWRNEATPLPRLADGSPVDVSAYTRVAWIHVGLRQVAQQPLGVGYGRNAFSHALRAQGDVRLGHAHSGFIDLGVGGGVPALALWAGFIVALVWVGWRAFSRHDRIAGLLLLLLASSYSGRMLIDSVNRDHMLQMFFFLTAVLLMLATAPPARR